MRLWRLRRMYNELVKDLKALHSVAFTEHEWETRPTGNHGTVQLDFAADQDSGDDAHMDTAYQGSVDLYTHGQGWDMASMVEHVLEMHCGASWHLNQKVYENATRLMHREYVFEIEVL